MIKKILILTIDHIVESSGHFVATIKLLINDQQNVDKRNSECQVTKSHFRGSRLTRYQPSHLDVPNAVVDPDDGDVPELRQSPGNHRDRHQRGAHSRAWKMNTRRWIKPVSANPEKPTIPKKGERFEFCRSNIQKQIELQWPREKNKIANDGIIFVTAAMQ